MLILSLDTSSRAGSIAVLRDESVVGVVSTWGDEAYSSRIFRQLEFLLAELGVKLEQFDLFAVASGPGSFTGLRVGLASAKAWSEAFGKKVAGIGVLEAVAAQCAYPAKVLVAAVDARRGQLYSAVFRREDDSLVTDGNELVLNGEELVALVSSHRDDVAVVTPEPQLVAKTLKPAGVPVFRASNVLAPWIGQLALARAQKGQLSDALTLDANYVRRSDAEVDAKGR
ncbi:MAG: tRNA (adenosine(37)-N6)-threonylcarbamoyltransferase complex dimerization subunit type 1 TsaB [Candidatus Acidiferrales bacterium]